MKAFDQPGAQFAGLGGAIIAIACRPRAPTLHRAKHCPLSTLRFRGMVPVGGWPQFLSAIDDTGAGALVWFGFETTSDAIRFAGYLENHGIAPVDDADYRQKPMTPHLDHGSIAITA